MQRIEEIAACRPSGILLREKDLTEDVYCLLAREVLSICRKYGTTCILHTFVNAAIELGAEAVHLPLPILRSTLEGQKKYFKRIGASCHSVEEAKEARILGCTYISAGHVFETDCKKGLPGRGLEFLEAMVQAARLPVYAIGGIDRENIGLIERTGARGACVMSGVMECQDVKKYLELFEGRK